MKPIISCASIRDVDPYRLCSFYNIDQNASDPHLHLEHLVDFFDGLGKFITTAPTTFTKFVTLHIHSFGQMIMI